MAFEDAMGRLSQWATGAEALAAVSATLSLRQQGITPPPEVGAALADVLAAAGLGDLDELSAPQQAALAGIAGMFLGHVNELLANPTREPGWAYTDPAILDGYGRGSAMLPGIISQINGDLAHVTRFLDVGVGVGFLAIAAAQVWPEATVVGIDPWEPSLQRARTNIAGAGLDERIELRNTTLADLGDVAAYDCVWIPSFFLTQNVLFDGLKTAHAALEPGGWVVVGTSRAVADELANAVSRLRWIRGGGTLLDPKEAVGLLEAAGYAEAQIAPPAPMPIDLVVARKR